MIVLMHSVYFPPEVGGLESHVFFLSRGLVARGHQVDVVTSRSRPDLPPHEVMDGVGVWRTWLPARNAP
ncbi:MAG TPA: glycosyltransferase, partial [Longimicrobiales bacterium]|nr:glycosyltransferase [Longimicrobiales bacterium]